MRSGCVCIRRACRGDLLIASNYGVTIDSPSPIDANFGGQLALHVLSPIPPPFLADARAVGILRPLSHGPRSMLAQTVREVLRVSFCGRPRTPRCVAAVSGGGRGLASLEPKPPKKRSRSPRWRRRMSRSRFAMCRPRRRAAGQGRSPPLLRTVGLDGQIENRPDESMRVKTAREPQVAGQARLANADCVASNQT